VNDRDVTLDLATRRTLAEAVVAVGGSQADREDLAWSRVARRNDERACVCRREAAELHDAYEIAAKRSGDHEHAEVIGR
jgi:hypothetical protein